MLNKRMSSHLFVKIALFLAIMRCDHWRRTTLLLGITLDFMLSRKKNTLIKKMQSPFATRMVEKVMSEVGKSPLVNVVRADVDKTNLIQMTVSVFATMDLRVFPSVQAYMDDSLVISHVVHSCVVNIQRIFKDGLIDVNDASYFLDLIQQIFLQVNDFNQKNITLKLSSDVLVELCGLIVNLIMGLIVKNDTQMKTVINITHSAMSLIKLTMAKTSWNVKCCCH